MKPILALTAAIVLSLFSPSAIAKDQEAFNFVGAYNQAQKQRMKADKLLHENMKIVSVFLVRFREENGHLPEDGVEIDSCTEKLLKLLKPNPYSVTGLQSKADEVPCKLRFVHDYSLNEGRRQEWLTRPPALWVADPGTITILMSQSSFYLIWGAGADHAPISSDAKGAKQCIFCWCEFQDPI